MITPFFELALTFYFTATIISVVELFRSSKTTTKIMLLFVAAGFVLHTISIVLRYADAGRMPAVNPHEATSFFHGVPYLYSSSLNSDTRSGSSVHSLCLSSLS